MTPSPTSLDGRGLVGAQIALICVTSDLTRLERAAVQIRRLRVRAGGDSRLRFSRECRGHCRRSAGAGRIARFCL